MSAQNGKRKLLGLGWTPVAIICLTLAILGATVLFGLHHVRESAKKQIITRDAEVMLAVSLFQEPVAREEAKEWEILGDPTLDWRFELATALESLQGVLAVRVHDEQGKFLSGIPVDVMPTDLEASDVEVLKAEEPISRFDPEQAASEIFSESESAELNSVLTVSIPLFNQSTTNGSQYAGSAQFVLDGDSIAGQLAELESDLWTQAVTIFVVAGAILLIGFAISFRQLGKYTEDLREANNQLALSARTSALGAVTAHLIHGLKNPLSGLHNFVSGQSAEGGDVDWDSAVASTRRMQTLINEVVSVLREEEAGAQYELELGELLEMVAGRTSALAAQLGSQLKTRRLADGSLNNRNANLVSLVLVNLVQNALQATPAGGSVDLHIERKDDSFRFEVRDHGRGLPDSIRENLFKPVSSTKEGGSGLGLAISNQLAGHLGAKLELKDTGEDGTCFVLTAPLDVFTEKTRLLLRAKS